MKRSLRGARGILTGASAGIGRALALELARVGARQVLVARSAAKLAEVASIIESTGGQAVVLSGDVTDPNVRAAAVQLATDRFGGLDFLINNAGVGALGRFEDASSERLRQVMEVNFFAAAELTRTALPVLRSGNRPIVVNVGSILGHRGIPHSSEYCASKFALRGLTESIRTELSRLGIDVLLVSPGTTETEFFLHALERQQVPWGTQKGVPAEVVARSTIRAMERGRSEIVVNPRGKALVLLNRFFPAALNRILRKYA